MDNTSNTNDNNNNSNDNNNNNASGRNNNGVATIDIIEIIPSPMVDGLQGTLVKQDMSYNDYLIDVSDLRKIMPIVDGSVSFNVSITIIIQFHTVDKTCSKHCPQYQ
eukprot:CAMPEP_0203639780 /NCGR_PEP_ID=MMETSP0088-20131115/5460_1 /ASSEMBLY_ACC=CAM_ASM_001087 /TAXON_ID=426623 /ORGANISM="Chaetoceros affinis, Strain CCMP159" /LENGTH=106 /DNA_ID=CAMNT_0050494769 /DNA_START=215 /DNA_END=535 /DNA_ORIENTATION=+